MQANHLGNLLSLPKTMIYQDWGKSQEFVVVVVVVFSVSIYSDMQPGLGNSSLGDLKKM